MIKIIQNPIFSWEPAVITIFTDGTVDEKDVSRVRKVVQNALNRRDDLKQCECFQNYLDVSRHGPKGIRVLCEWLCRICLPKILEQLEQNVPRLQQIELGLAQEIDPFKSRFLLVPARKVTFGNEEEVLVPAFSISLRDITVGEFSAFCNDTQYKTVAEEQRPDSNYRSNSGLWDFSAEARLNTTATHLSFIDAQAYCKRSGRRLPTEAEFLAASLLDDEIRANHDSATEQKVRTLLAEGKLPTFAGTTITSTFVDNERVVMRSGPKYTREVGWQSDEKYQRHLRSKDYFDATTSFHLCEI